MNFARHRFFIAALLLWGQPTSAQTEATDNQNLAEAKAPTIEPAAPPSDAQQPQAAPRIAEEPDKTPASKGIAKDGVADPVEAKAWVDKAVATTGDIITYTVEISYGPGISIDLPEPGADIAGLRILDFGAQEPDKEEEATVERRWYKLRADLVGSYVLPPVVVHYTLVNSAEVSEKQTIATSQIFIEVESVLPADGEATDIRDIKPLYPSHGGLPWWAITAMAVGAALLIAGLLYGLLRRKSAVVIPPTPPHEIAFAALDALRQTDFDNLEAIREYYFRISEVLRAYIEGTFELNATDLTTEEILPRLLELPELGPQEHMALGEFLRHTDRVKFAEHSPSADEIERAYEHALGFVEATMPQQSTEGAV